MQKRKLTDKELDVIGKRLFAASRLTDAEIDRIASAPDLFESVLARIGRVEFGSDSRPGRRAFFTRLAAGSSFAALMICGVLAFFLQQDQPGHVVTDNSVERPDVARALTPQVRYVKGFTQARAAFLDENVTPVTPKIEHAVQREIRRPQPRVQHANFTQPRENDFVAVTYVGEGAESTRGGRVVRVDVPRSTLFAMGFDVSLENDSPTIKADLLIGPDGVTRAVRLVE